MANFSMTQRVMKLRTQRSSSIAPSRVFVSSLNKLPYVVPAVIGAAPFLFKYLDPFSFGSASLFFDKEQ